MCTCSNRIKLDELKYGSSIFVFAILVLFYLLPADCMAQEIRSDSSRIDSISVPKHSPRKATVMSALVPGLGQGYNKKYWKIPVIYAGLGTSVYFIKFNNDYFQRYRKGYISLLNKDTLNDPFRGQYSSEQLFNAKEYYRRNRDLSIIIAAGIYILNIIDATVDAHLFYFDVSDDLAMKVQPAMLTGGFAGPTPSIPGISFTFMLNNKER
jgi:hypothetical protein